MGIRGKCCFKLIILSAATFSILIRGHEAHLEDDDEGEDDGDDHDDELQQ